jgi:hypothetical protein
MLAEEWAEVAVYLVIQSAQIWLAYRLSWQCTVRHPASYWANETDS